MNFEGEKATAYLSPANTKTSSFMFAGGSNMNFVSYQKYPYYPLFSTVPRSAIKRTQVISLLNPPLRRSEQDSLAI